jgi:hypothetical protein
MQPLTPPPDVGGPLRRYAPALAVVVVIALIGVVGSQVSRTAPTNGGSGTVGQLPLTPDSARAANRSVDFGPNCDPATGRIKVPSVYAPPCVAPPTAGNGGATWTGVTKNTIVVAVYQGAPDLLAQATLAAGGSSDTSAQTAATLQDYVTFFESHYQTWGRKIRLVNVDASGGVADDAAAKADAIRVATEIKAFASFGGPTQTDAYAAELAARHVLCIGCATGTTDATIRADAPYVWGMQPSPEQSNILTAEYIGKRLAGQPAAYAGDPAMTRRRRVFGLLSYDTESGTFGPVRDDLTKDLAAYGVSFASVGTYTLDVTQAQELARTLVTKMKGAGVTSVVLDGDPFAPVFLTKEATNQGYFPEWIVTGSVLTDTSAFARLYDQRQWAHAFGISELSGRVTEVHSEAFRLYEWQFGRKPPAESTYPLIYLNPFVFFTGVHLAGPHLTPASFQAGLFSFPPSGTGPTNAQVSFGRHGFWPNDDYLGFDDATIIWWDPNAKGEDEIGRHGTGLYRYEDSGRRYLPGHFPRTPDHPFDPVAAVSIFDPPPPADLPPSYPSPAP